ncbi:hypothetical protein EC988_005410 [Linderina pennispora]|nr:hypothetical protein EC988_005410 [Linderina pennispora]
MSQRSSVKFPRKQEELTRDTPKVRENYDPQQLMEELKNEVLTEEEQLRILQKLIYQTDADIETFSTFLKLPVVVTLMLNLIFVYRYVMGGLAGYGQGLPTLPFVSYEIRSRNPIMATELGVVILQFVFYMLSSRRWGWIMKSIYWVLAVSGIGHAMLCEKTGFIEFLWWMLPVLNLLVVGYAQFNMRRSLLDIEELAKKTYHVKSA